MEMKRKPSHPGEILYEWIRERGLSVSEVANSLDLTRPTLSTLLNKRSRCSMNMAARLSVYTGTSVDFWLNLQHNVDLHEAKNIETSPYIKPYEQKE